MTKVNYRKLSARLIAVWFSFSLIASAFNAFRADSNRPPLALGLAAITPIAVFLAWFAISKPFRDFALALNPRVLTLVHAWRIAGFVFLVLFTYGILPGAFALPAGWGDVAIGLTAPFVAWRLAQPDHRRSFILWQALGMLDLVTALVLAATVRLIDPLGIPTTPMSVLPLSFIPTFAVPLLLILHIICIAQARNWAEKQYSPLGVGLPSLPV